MKGVQIGEGLKLALYVGFFLLFVACTPGLPPHAEYSQYRSFPTTNLDSCPEGRKDGLSDPDIIFKGKIKGPKSFASYNGKLYTGVLNGYVVRIDDVSLVPVVKFGTSCDQRWEDPKCGRPLDMKFDKDGALYVCARIQWNIQSRRRNRRSGNIYWTHYSTVFELIDLLYTNYADPSGRFMLYNATSGDNQVLIRGIAANGVALSEDGESALIADTLSSRILKYTIKGTKAGSHEDFAIDLPGQPLNILPDGRGRYLVTLMRLPRIVSMAWYSPCLRRMFSRLVYLAETPLRWLDSNFFISYLRRLLHFVRNFEGISRHMPKIAVVLTIDREGKIIDTVCNFDLGSPFADYLSRVLMKQAFPQLAD
ncbi:hypothetical protein QAD02_001259 [Eretmocerus hayati]|uniref:Uncharacterized protein n=1 Tax=Eretmocerus hayati TaxID=131215 RepID=A0ACC2NFM9_9HYME|nr:hypothetical protein QAD02_001259 [Eretmocerus hayati]